MNMIRMKLIGNNIGIEGAKMISEVLKSNSTLTSLNLSGDEKKNKNKEKKEMGVENNVNDK